MFVYVRWVRTVGDFVRDAHLDEMSPTASKQEDTFCFNIKTHHHKTTLASRALAKR